MLWHYICLGIMWRHCESSSNHGSRRYWTECYYAQYLDQCIWHCWKTSRGTLYIPSYYRKCKATTLSGVCLEGNTLTYLFSKSGPKFPLQYSVTTNVQPFHLQGISPDVVTYTTLMKACIRAKKYTKVCFVPFRFLMKLLIVILEQLPLMKFILLIVICLSALLIRHFCRKIKFPVKQLLYIKIKPRRSIKHRQVGNIFLHYHKVLTTYVSD